MFFVTIEVADDVWKAIRAGHVFPPFPLKCAYSSQSFRDRETDFTQFLSSECRSQMSKHLEAITSQHSTTPDEASSGAGEIMMLTSREPSIPSRGLPCAISLNSAD